MWETATKLGVQGQEKSQHAYSQGGVPQENEQRLPPLHLLAF